MARKNFDTSVDVVYDLMIHDIELVNSLVQSKLVSVSALNADVADKLGHVVVQLRYKSGTIVKLTASRISHKRSRKMQIQTQNACYDTDFITKEVTVYSSDTEGYAAHSLEVVDAEPLKAELTHFLEAVKTRSDKLATAAYDGYQAVVVAASIKQALTQKLYSHSYE